MRSSFFSPYSCERRQRVRGGGKSISASLNDHQPPIPLPHLTHKLKTKPPLAQSCVDPEDGNMHPRRGGDEPSWVYGDSFSREERRGDFPGGPVAETLHSPYGGAGSNPS